MKITVLNALDSGNLLPGTLKSIIDKTGGECTWFELEEMNIMPCRSCSSCGERTPGRCVLDDDMQSVLRAFARSDLVVFLTKVTFGGYSSRLKKGG